jgi:hypothetical protein
MAEHRNCARHIYANWRKTYKKKEFQKLFWKCAKAPSVILFNLALAKLKQATREGGKAALKTNPHHWSRAYFRLGSNCDSVDNNMCESFNKWIVEARFFPIISMLESIRRKVMVRIQEQRDKSDRLIGPICPNISKKLNTYIKLSQNCSAIYNGEDRYEVKYFDVHRFTVSLSEKTCSCRYWQLSGLPCPHAVVCIHHKTNSLDDYVAPCFRVSEFKKTYAYCLNPLNGMPMWPKSRRAPPVAPGYVKMPGRPKKERKREPHEKPKATRVSKVGTVSKCSVCSSSGHNKTTCNKPGGGRYSVGATPQQNVEESQQSTAPSRKRKSSSNRNVRFINTFQFFAS